MRHVFVETNWVIDYAAPEHRRGPGAHGLLERSRQGDIKLYLPALCLVEARRTLLTKFQPRGEANAIRHYVRWAMTEGKVSQPDGRVVMKVVDMFEAKVRGTLDHLDEAFLALRSEPGLEIFPLNDRHLELSTELSFQIDLNPFDQSVLAAILGRTDELLEGDPGIELAFCELDGDMQPWDKQGRPRSDLGDLYDPRGIWVYGDFDMNLPERPIDCNRCTNPTWRATGAAGTMRACANVTRMRNGPRWSTW